MPAILPSIAATSPSADFFAFVLCKAHRTPISPPERSRVFEQHVRETHPMTNLVKRRGKMKSGRLDVSPAGAATTQLMASQDGATIPGLLEGGSRYGLSG